MLPTNPIASIAPAQPSAEHGCASEPQSNDAFAQALQRARGAPAQANASAPKSGDAQGRAAHAAQPRQPTRETTQQPAGEAAAGETRARDATAPAKSTDSMAGDAPSRGVREREETAAAPMTVDAALVPQAAMTPNSIKPPHAGEAAEGALPADDRTIGRTGARVGARELRSGQPAHGLNSAGEGAGERDLTDAALPWQAALERAAGDAAGTPTIQQRAPAFERLANEPVLGSPFATSASAREIGAAVAATSVDKHIAQATVHAAVDEPGFGVAVGAQVALWVRDGVQEARLQLHPAELGPVTVQIALEGQAAHVDFTAAVAATRESIEQSLPALAAALRESGFTLAGGGVSSQADGGGRRERAPNGRGSGVRSGEALDTAQVAATPRRWTRSLLDVYA